MNSTPGGSGKGLIVLAIIVNSAGAILVSALQVWSAATATTIEVVGRPLVVLGVSLLVLTSRPWTKWLMLLFAAITGAWLAYSAATSSLFGLGARIAVTLVAAIVIASGFVGWHPQLRRNATSGRRGTGVAAD